MSKKQKTSAVSVSVSVVEGGWLQKLLIRNFLSFRKLELSLSQHLNVIIGENGTGKSQLLKLAYCAVAASIEGHKKFGEPTSEEFAFLLTGKLNGVFRPRQLGNLVSWQADTDNLINPEAAPVCQVEAAFFEPDYNHQFYFNADATTKVNVVGLPTKYVSKDFRATFLPPKEMLTLYPNFVATYDNYFLNFEETDKDICMRLGAPLAKEVSPEIQTLLDLIEKILAAKVVLDKNGEFYLLYPNGKKREMSLVAEGHRKIAMIAQLLANKTLSSGAVLFWDEPEANLNPKLIKHIAEIIYALSRHGIQVFIATHSLFLMRELEILHKFNNESIAVNAVSLRFAEGSIVIEQSDHFDGIQHVASLDEDLNQSDRFMDAFND